MTPTCPICSSEKIHNHILKDSFQTVKCGHCGVIFTEGVTQEQLDRFYDHTYFNSEETVIGYKDYLHSAPSLRANARDILRIADKVSSLKGKTVLDIGCAAGFLLDEARQGYGCRVTGLEPSAVMSSYAAETLGLNIVTTSLKDEAFTGLSFDAIFLIGTIEHLLHPRDLVNQVWHLLKPGGIFVVTTIDTLGVLPIYSIKPPEHIIYFSHKNIALLLKQCGFASSRHSLWFARYRVQDLFYRLYEFSKFRPFKWMDKLMGRVAPDMHWRIPTNEMIVIARKE